MTGRLAFLASDSPTDWFPAHALKPIVKLLKRVPEGSLWRNFGLIHLKGDNRLFQLYFNTSNNEFIVTNHNNILQNNNIKLLRHYSSLFSSNFIKINS